MGENINSRQTVQNNILDVDTVGVMFCACEKSQQVYRKLNAIPRQAWSTISAESILSGCRRNSQCLSISNLHSLQTIKQG